MGDKKRLTACEIIEIARGIEESGKAAYLEMKAATQDPDMMRLLDYLATEEAGHIVLFDQMAGEMKCQLDRMADPSPEDEAYLQVIMKSVVFQDSKAGLRRARAAKTPQEMLRFAMQFERDAMLFWLKLFQMVNAADREIIGRLIREEEKHVRDIDHLSTQRQFQEHGALEA